MLSARLLPIAAFALLFALPTQAQNSDAERRRSAQRAPVERQNDQTIPVNQTVTAQGGERFQVEGNVRFDVHVRGQEGDAMQATGQISGNGLTVTRLRDRQVFRATGVERFSRTFRRPGRERITTSTVVGFDLVSPAQEPALRLYLNMEGALASDGELTARVTDVRLGARNGSEGGGRYEREFQIDGRNAQTFALDRTIRARGGERFRVEGDLALAANVSRVDGERILVTALADANDLRVTWLDDRQVFEVEGSEKMEETLREPRRDSASFSSVLSYRLVPVRQEHLNTAPEYRLYLQIQGDVTRDGSLTIRIADMEIR